VGRGRKARVGERKARVGEGGKQEKKIREEAAKYLPGSEMNLTLGAKSSARFSLIVLVNLWNNSASEP
jgi:hypothetical protein